MHIFQAKAEKNVWKLLLVFGISCTNTLSVQPAYAEDTAKPKVVEFYASWCEPCRIQEPSLERLKQEYGTELDFVRCDVDDPQYEELAKKYDVCLIPTVIFLDANHKVCARSLGCNQDQVINKCIDKILPENHVRTVISVPSRNMKLRLASEI
jgi:thioredoxin 1